ncbi:MAG: hypothetical protein FWE06_04875 [Oscillospiraceae bacterium]|nr:hypothetical protein [Oscillospiraceae bacterium]
MKYDAEKLKSVLSKYKYLLIVVAMGVALLIWPSSRQSTVGQTSSAQAEYAQMFSTAEMETRLSEALARVEGVGRVEVVLTLRSGTETVFQTENSKRVSQQRENGETIDYNNDTTESTLVLARGGGVQEPAVVMKRSPEFMGALIIADGGNEQVVALQIINAVTALTGIPSDRIAVVGMQTPAE